MESKHLNYSVANTHMLTLEALRPNMDMLKAGLSVFQVSELKYNLTDFTVWNTGEAGDIFFCWSFVYLKL